MLLLRPIVSGDSRTEVSQHGVQASGLSLAQEVGGGMTYPTISQALGKFFWACAADDLDKKTIRWYRSMLKEFGEQYGKLPVNKVSTDLMRAVVIEIRQSDKTENTANDRIRALRRFWNWSAAEYEFTSPMSRIRLRNQPVPVPRAVRTQDLVKMFKACGTGMLGDRDRALLIVAAETGLRASELISIQEADLDRAAHRIIVKGKGGKFRGVTYGRYTEILLNRWLQVRPAGGQTLFCQRTGAALTYWGLLMLGKRLATRAGIAKFRWHSVRHWAARESLRNGLLINFLQSIMGHASIDTTVRYYGIFTNEEIAAAAAAHSPLQSLFPQVKETI
jgi:integrase/recombinase XerD